MIATRVDTNRRLIRNVAIEDGNRSLAARLEGAAVGIGDLSKPPRIQDAVGTLESVRFESGGIVANLRYLENSKMGPRLAEDIERGIGLFRLAAVKGSRGTRVVLEVRSRALPGNRHEQAPSVGISLRQFWREPAVNSMAAFWK
jgi:hypothetical protein